MTDFIMKERTNRRNVTLTIALALLMVALFSTTACSKKAEPKEEVKASTEKVAETKVEEVVEATVEEVVEPATEVATEVETETVVETEVATYETAIAWAKTVKEEEPRLSIWNNVTKQATLLENGQKYVVKEGDILVLCCRFEGEMFLDEKAPMLRKILSTTIHEEYEFTEIPTEETDIYFLVEVNGKEYELSLTIVSENATSTGEASETSKTADMSGKDWVNTLEYEVPKLVAWNDETGTKEVIEDGGEYIMQAGDTLAIYCPEEYIISSITPFDFAGGLTMMSKCAKMEYNLPTESQELNLEVEVFDSADVYSTFKYVITTP